MHQFVELVARRAISAGIFGAFVLAIQVTGVSDCQRQLAYAFGAVKHPRMRNKTPLHGIDKMFFYIVKPYGVAKIHEFVSLNNL